MSNTDPNIANINAIPDQLLLNLNELLHRSTLGHSEPAITPLTRNNAGGGGTAQNTTTVGAIVPTDLLSGTGLSNIRIANIAFQSTSQAERLLQHIQLLKLKQIHNNTDGKLNHLTIQRDEYERQHGQNLAVLETALDLVSGVISDCEVYQQSNVLDYIQLDD